MDILTPNQDKSKLSTELKAEVLSELEFKVKGWMEKYLAKRNLWFSSDFLPADESKHYIIYRNVFKAILEIDPNRALNSALEIMLAIDMPGVSMPNFREMAYAVRRANIYGPRHYKKIVEEALRFWNVEVLQGLNEIGRIAQDKLMAIPKKLEKVAEYFEQKKKENIPFELIYNRLLV